MIRKVRLERCISDMKRGICATCVLLPVCLFPPSPLFARAFGTAESGMGVLQAEASMLLPGGCADNAPPLVTAPSRGGNCTVHRLAANAGKVLPAPPAVWRRPYARKKNIRVSHAVPLRVARYEVFFWKRPPPAASLT